MAEDGSLCFPARSKRPVENIEEGGDLDDHDLGVSLGIPGKAIRIGFLPWSNFLRNVWKALPAEINSVYLPRELNWPSDWSQHEFVADLSRMIIDLLTNGRTRPYVLRGEEKTPLLNKDGMCKCFFRLPIIVSTTFNK